MIPANGDGPGINIIRNASGQLDIPAPPTWYVLLPGMSYSWRVRVTEKATFAGEDDPAWGTWSESRTFRTPAPSSVGVQAITPPDGSRLAGAGAVVMQWSHPSPSLFYWEVQVSGDTRFDTDPASATSFVYWNLVHGGITNPPNSWQTPPLESGRPYYWRVRPRVQGDGAPVPWSQTFFFCDGCFTAAPPSNAPTTPPPPQPTATPRPQPTATPVPQPTRTATPVLPPTPTATATVRPTSTPLPPAPPASGAAITFAQLNGNSFLVGMDASGRYAQYLGDVSSNCYGTNSITNKYGDHGSPYSSTSIRNQYGDWGSPYSSRSATNPYAGDPPIIAWIANGAGIGYLTENTAKTSRADTSALLAYLDAVGGCS